MNGPLKITTSLSQPCLSSSVYTDVPISVLLEIDPAPSAAAATRPPLNLVVVVDSSATMHHFHLTEEEREYWMALAISREEFQRGEADEADAMYWTGQTLSEMQNDARTPMMLAADALLALLNTLVPTDQVAVYAFADGVHTVFNQQDWTNFPDGCRSQVGLLREQRLPVDIGMGTHMAEALRQASSSLGQHLLSPGVNRLIVISDGIVQDQDATLSAIEEIQSRGMSITTVGVGDEFDEEFLMRVADNSRGEYHYAADITDLMGRLEAEMSTLQTMTLTDLYVAVRGLEGAVVQDLFLVQPAMTLFDEIYTEEGWLRARVGDVSSLSPASVIIQAAPPLLAAGEHVIIEALLTWTNPGGSASEGSGYDRAEIAARFTPDDALVSERDAHVQDLVERFGIYRYEREAQRAQSRGDIETAREKLGAATRQLYRLGEEKLAQDMEEQIVGLGAATTDPSRAKRIKATTRRLASSSGRSSVTE